MAALCAQAGILRLLAGLQQEMGLALLLITHDLGVVAEMADEVAVMYAGRVVERGTAKDIFEDPQHPYTRKLMAAVPIADPARRHLRARRLLTDEIPSPVRALGDEPQVAPLVEIGPGHFVARHTVGGLAA